VVRVIAASGVRFDGLDLLVVLALVSIIVVLVSLYFVTFGKKVDDDIDRLLKTTGPKLSMDEMDGLLRTDYLALLTPNLSATPYFLDSGTSLPKLWSLMDEEWKYGISESPMPTPFYDWANERPVPLVNW
jgi:hypothetical protein